MGSAQQELEFRVIQTPTEKNVEKIPLNLLSDEPWISDKNARFPQELILALRKEANVEKVQLLCHNAYIPHKIELFVGQIGKKEHWKQLGTVTLKQVKSSDTKHELKTVYLDEVCTGVKMKIHQNYEHKTANPNNQVGLVQFRLFGTTLAMAKETEPYRYVEQAEKKRAADSKKSETDSTYSDEIGDLLDSIERSKERAISVSDFQLAKSAQQAIRTLTKARREMEELEKDMGAAVKQEDFERAHDIRQELKTFRANLIATVDPSLIEDQPPNDPLHAKTTPQNNSGIYRPKELFDGEPIIYPPPKPKLFDPIQLSPTEKYAPIDMNFLMPPRPSSHSTISSAGSSKRSDSASTTRTTSSTQTVRAASPLRGRSPSPLMQPPRFASVGHTVSTSLRKPSSPKNRLSPIPSPSSSPLKGILRRPHSAERTSKNFRSVTTRSPSPLPFTTSPPTRTRTEPKSSHRNDQRVSGSRKKPASAHRSASFSSASSSSSSRPSSFYSRNPFQEKEAMVLPAVQRRQAEKEKEREGRRGREEERDRGRGREGSGRRDSGKAEEEARERARRNEESVRRGKSWDSEEEWRRRASDSELSVPPRHKENRGEIRGTRIEELLDLVAPDERGAMGDALRIFGDATMAKVYAKQWEERREGLREIRARLERLSGKEKKEAEDAMRAVTTLLGRSLRDKLHNVYVEGLALLEYVATAFIPANGLHGHSKALADVTHEILVNKAGDTINARITDRRSSAETLKSVAAILNGDRKVARAFATKFVNNKEREGTRAEKGRAKIVMQAVEEHGANNEMGLSEICVGRFGVACMKSSDAEVRTIGKDLFLKVFRTGGQAARLRSLLPDPTSHQAQASIFKALFSEIDNRQSMSIAPVEEPRRRSNSKSAKSVRITDDAKPAPPGNVDYDKMCMFCGLTDDSFTPSELDKHYLNECPLLSACPHCGEVIEVADLRAHLLRECRAKGVYKVCPTCREPIDRKDFHRHVGKKNCHPSPPNCTLCLLCGDEVSPANDVGWRRHLLNDCEKGRAARGRRRRGKPVPSARIDSEHLFIPRG